MNFTLGITGRWIVFLGLTAIFPLLLQADDPSPPLSIPLWPHGAPDARPPAGPEIDTSGHQARLIAGRPVIRWSNVSVPTLTVYQPTGKSTGAAAVVFPGGGYSILALDLEGTEVCHWLNSIGVTGVLLKYRVPGSGPYPKSKMALEDAQRALGIVRSRADAWHIDPHRIGVFGFSAGGHLAAALSTHFEERLYPAGDAADQVSCRPDFACIIYPAYLAIAERNFAPNEDLPVTARTPPAFLVQAEDDSVHVENCLAYFLALKAKHVPAEMHLYAQGGHGYGLRPTALPITTWPQTAERWLRTVQMIP